jgi:predicted metal-binding membrane protein
MKAMQGGSTMERPTLIRTQAVLVLLTSLLAWTVMLLQHSALAQMLPPILQLGHAQNALSLPWMISWLIMVVAMMLPPALPFLNAIQKLVYGLPKQYNLQTLATVLFISAWMIVGAGLALTGQMVEGLLLQWRWGIDHATLLTAASAILAGAYQLSPVKRTCLLACRSPVGVILGRWNPHQRTVSITRITLRYAMVCIGCCWPLMALTLAVGSITLPVMVMVSVLMALERLLPATRPLVPLQAGFAFVLGFLLLTQSIGIHATPPLDGSPHPQGHHHS